MAFYAVKKGFAPGVYKNWNDCKKNVEGFPGAVYKKFDSEAEALGFVNGEVTVKPKKYYAVQRGLVPGVYSSWEACKANIDGFPGARYKSFILEEEAQAYAEGREFDSQTQKYEKVNVDEDELTGVVAYVDGSYDEETGTYAYGIVIINGDEEVHMSGKGNDPDMASMHNVAGEILGSMEAMKWARDNGIIDITICHDYSGIAEWALGNWKRNKRCTQEYYEFCREMKRNLNYKFHKVKGHSNNFYNDVVDALAKMELGIENGIKKKTQKHIEDIASKKE